MLAPVRSRERSTTPVTKPTTSRSPGSVDGGHLGGLAADECDVGFGAGGGHAADELFDDRGVDLVEAEVVEEGERARAHDGDVAGDGSDEIAAEVFVALRHDGDESLGADAVGALHHDGIGHAFDRVGEREECAEGAEAGEHCGRVRACDVRLHAADGFVAGFDVHTGGLVVDGLLRVRHRLSILFRLVSVLIFLYPRARVVEEALPGAVLEGAGPGVLEAEGGALGVRHDDERAAVGGGERGGAAGRAGGVERVVLRGVAVGVDVAGGDGVCGCEVCGVAFAVRDDDGHARAGHVGEEDGRGRLDFDHAEAGLVARGDVAHEARPVLSAGDEVAELRHHLAAVADAEREGFGAREEGGEGVAELVVEENCFGPAAAGAEDVAVGEATAGGEADEGGEVGAAGEEVAHGDVDAFEAGAVEGGGHLVLAVDALLTQDGDARLGDDEIGHAGEVRCGREEWGADALGEIEGDVDEEAGAVGVVEERRTPVVRSRGCRGARRCGSEVSDQILWSVVRVLRVDEIVRVAEGELVGGGGVADELCGEAGGVELIEDGGGVFGADLDDGAELFG